MKNFAGVFMAFVKFYLENEPCEWLYTEKFFLLDLRNG